MVPSRVSLRLARAQLALGWVFACSFVAFAFWDRFPAPYRDDWDWFAFLLDGPGGIAALLTPHNEHLIPLARLLVAWQYRIAGLSGALIQNVALVLHVLTVGLVCLEVHRHWSGRPVMRRFALGCVLVCLSLTLQLQSMIFAAAVLFPLVQFFAVVTLVAVARATEPGGRHRTAWGLATGIAALAAAASTTTGLVVPALAAGLVVLRRGSRRLAAALVFLSVAGVAVYLRFVHTVFSAVGTGAVEPWHLPGAGTTLAYFAAVFGVGLTSVSASAGVVAGAAGVATAVVACVIVVRHPASASRMEWVAVGIIAFGLISAAMAAPGRAQFGIGQAAQSRYATFVLATVAATFLLVFSRLDGVGFRPRARAAAAAAVVCASALALIPQLYLGLVWRAKADLVAAAALTVRTRTMDPQWLTVLHPLPEPILRTLRPREGAPRHLADPVVGRVVSVSRVLNGCAGDLALVRFGALGEMRLTGTVTTVAAGLLVLDAANVVVGLGRPAPWVRDPQASVGAVELVVRQRVRAWPSRDDAWFGFASAGGGPPYRALAVDAADVPVCEAALRVRPVIHVQLDAPQGAVEGTVPGGGWAFACGARLVRWDVLVDGRPVAATVTTGVPRPDVQDAFRLQCAPVEAPGVHFPFEAGGLAPGPHTVALRVTTTAGDTAESPVQVINVPARAQAPDMLTR